MDSMSLNGITIKGDKESLAILQRADRIAHGRPRTKQEWEQYWMDTYERALHKEVDGIHPNLRERIAVTCINRGVDNAIYEYIEDLEDKTNLDELIKKYAYGPLSAQAKTILIKRVKAEIMAHWKGQ